MNFRKLLTYLAFGTAAVIPFATAQNPTILQGSYISNVFGQSNFIKNPNAQTNLVNVTTVTATVVRSTTTPLVATSEFTVAIGTANGTATWSTRTFDVGMKNNNCEARFSYRGFAATSKVDIKQGANTVATLSLTPATDPRIASINFPCGDLSVATTFVVTDTSTLAGTNEIGGIYVGLATNMANVAQAEFVGGGQWTSVSIYRSAAAIQATFAAYTNGAAGTPLGRSTTASSDTTVTFPNLPAGQYYVNTNFFTHMYAGNNSYVSCDFTIQEIDSNAFSGTSSSTAQHPNGDIYSPAGQLSGHFTFTTSGQRRFRIMSKNALASGAVSRCQSTTDAPISGIYVYRFPSASELVVTPERQNTFASASWPVGNTGSIYSFSTTSTTAQNVVNSGYASSSALYYGAAAPSATTNIYGIKVNNIPPGVYRITAQVSVSQTAGFDCSAELHDNSNRIASVNSGLNIKSGLVAIYRVTSFQASQDFTIKLRADNAAVTCTVNSGNGGLFNPSIVFEPLDQPSNSALYVQGPVLGAQTGAAIPAGYVGNQQTCNGVRNFISHTSGGVGFSMFNAVSSGCTMTPGVFLVRWGCAVNVTSGTTTGQKVCIPTTDNADGWGPLSNLTNGGANLNIGSQTYPVGLTAFYSTDIIRVTSSGIVGGTGFVLLGKMFNTTHTSFTGGYEFIAEIIRLN